MNSEERQNVLFSTIQVFGEEAQMVKALEEMGELTQVLAKRINGYPVALASIAEEIADVLIVVKQLEYMVGTQFVEQHLNYKLERLKATLEGYIDVPAKKKRFTKHRANLGSSSSQGQERDR